MSDFLPGSKSFFNGTQSIQLIKLLEFPDMRTPSPTTSQGGIDIYFFLK